MKFNSNGLGIFIILLKPLYGEKCFIRKYTNTNTNKDDHEEKLNDLLDSISNRGQIILLGNLNAHVGSKKR